MKIVKYLLFLLLIFIIAGSIYVATKQGDYEVEKEYVVEAPIGFVFSEVNNFENWEKWGPWTSTEDANVSVSETTSGEGAHLSWRSNERGDGSITTTKTTPNEQIVQEVSLDHSYGTSTANIIWEFEELEEGTRVVVRVEGDMDFKEKLHWETSSSNVNDFFGNMLEENLVILEEDLQQQMEAYSINVRGETEYGGGYFMYTSTSARQENVQNIFKELSSQIQGYMEENGFTDNGSPFILYHDWDDENGTTLFSVGVPTPTKVATPTQSSVLSGYLPTQHVVRTTLKGDRKNLPEAWDAAFRYIEENNLKLPEDYKPFEVYITKESREEIPANLITEIYIPVEDPVEDNSYNSANTTEY